MMGVAMAESLSGTQAAGSSVGLIGILAAIVFAVPAVIWVMLRLYVTIAVFGCRGCRALSESARETRCRIPAAVLEQLVEAGSRMKRVLVMLAVMLVVVWLMAQTQYQSMAVNGLYTATLVCVVLMVLAKLTEVIASMAMPAVLPCRTKLRDALGKSGKGIGWIIGLYVLLHLLLTLG